MIAISIGVLSSLLCVSLNARPHSRRSVSEVMPMLDRLRRMFGIKPKDRRSAQRTTSARDERVAYTQRLSAVESELSALETARLLRITIETEKPAIHRGYEPHWEEQSG